MYRQNKTLILFIILLANSLNTKGQNSENQKEKIGIIGKYIGNKVVVRWAPSNNVSFKLLMEYGYKLEKAKIGQDTNFYKAKYKTIGTFKPADSATWESRVDVKNTYQVVAAQAAIGQFRNKVPENPNLKELKNRYNEEKNIHGFALLAADMDTTAANLLGLRYEDADVKSNATYVYRITSLVPKSKLDIEISSCFVECKQQMVLTPPKIIAYGYEKHIKLGWPTLLHQQMFSGYYLEKGNSRGKRFKQYNKMPYIFAKGPDEKESEEMITITDKVPEDYVTYSYRIRGVTPFGEISEPSEIVYSYGRDRTPPENAYNITATDINGEYLSINWKKDNFEKDFVGFNVLRSNNSKGPFTIINENILDDRTSSFTDKNPDALAGSFYKIETIDTAKNRSWSLGVYGFLKDSIAPQMPTGLKATVDTNGVVTLIWNLGKELDIKGYRVYYANQENHEFTNITPNLYQDTVFIDSVNIHTLTENIYYQIAVADYNFNHSKRTQIIKVKLPDTIPPVRPLFKDILVTDTAIYLTWIPSTSKDVEKHKIYRKIGKGNYTLWQTINGKTRHTITDKDINIGGIYAYKIIAIDDVNNRSPYSNEVSGKIYDVGRRNPINNFNVVYNTEKKRMVLSWSYPTSTKYHYVIYRSYNNSSFKIYKSLDATKNSYEDWNLLGKGTYTYAIMANYNDGGTSGLSNKKSAKK